MALIKKYCERCCKEINGDEGVYLQLVKREDRTERFNAFLCDECLKYLNEVFW